MTSDGLLFELKDRTAVLQVWALPQRFVAMRWPSAGQVRVFTIAWRHREAPFVTGERGVEIGHSLSLLEREGGTARSVPRGP